MLFARSQPEIRSDVTADGRVIGQVGRPELKTSNWKWRCLERDCQSPDHVVANCPVRKAKNEKNWSPAQSPSNRIGLEPKSDQLRNNFGNYKIKNEKWIGFQGPGPRKRETSGISYHPSFFKIWHTMYTMFCFGIFGELRPKVPVQIGNLTVQSLFDSGSGLTLLSYRAFKKLRPAPVLHKSRVRLTAANGSNLEVRGYAILNYKLGNREVQRRTLIVDGLQTASIIGVDTMIEENILIDHGNQKVIIKPKPISLTGWSPKAFCILPLGQKVISLSNQKLPDGLVLAKGPMVPEGVSEIKNGRFTVCVQNNTMVPKYVPRGAEICSVRKLDPKELELKDSQSPDKPKYSAQKIPEQELNRLVKNVPLGYQKKYQELLQKFSDIFALDPNTTGHVKIMPHKIRLKDEQAICSQPSRRLPRHLFGIAKSYVEKLLAQGIIRPSTSPWNSPLMIVRKPKVKNDENLPIFERFRAVNDFRRLNSLTIRDSYPLRNLHELLDELGTGKIYSSLDLAAGFHHQELTECSKEKTAFSLPGHGLYEFNRLSMGLMNSPGAFQRLCEYCLRGLKHVFVYIDDIAIIGQTHDQHLEQLEAVFGRLRKYGFKLRLSKLQIATAELNYLGHNITKKGIRPGQAKVQAIKDWKPPTDQKQIRQYLGLCGFFRRNIVHFAKLSAPLTELTRKDTTWKGGKLPKAAEQAFYALKAKLITRPCLAPVDWDREMICTSDGSAEGFGCMLSQIGPDGLERAVAYGSRATKPHEKKQSPFKLESAAMAYAFNLFRPYLLGKHFLARTDCKSLVNVNNVRGPGLDNLYAQLQEYDFRVVHFPGSKMPVDGLSRSAVYCTTETQDWDLGWSAEKVKRMQSDDKYLKALACYLMFGLKPHSRDLHRWVKEQAKSAEFNEHGILGIRANMDYTTGVRSFRILAPLHIRSNLLELAHDQSGHFGYHKCYQLLKSSWTWPDMKESVKRFCQSCEKCQRVNPAQNLRPVPLEPMDEAKFFNSRVHIDILGKLPQGPHGHNYLLVAIDAFSGLVHLSPLKSKETESVAQALVDGWFSIHSYPLRLNQDQGPEFASSLMESICKKLNISRFFSSKMHPISNGICERSNRTILTLIRKIIESNQDWVSLCPSLQKAMNCAPHSTKRFSPFQLAFGRRPRVPSDLLRPGFAEEGAEAKLSLQIKMFKAVQKWTKEAFDRQKREYDKRATRREFMPGDITYVVRPHSGPLFQKFQTKFSGPWQILKRLQHGNYELVHLDTLKIFRCHINRIKPGHFREQLYQETGNTPIPNQPTRKSPRLNQPSGVSNQLLLEDPETFRVAAPQPQAAGWRSPSNSGSRQTTTDSGSTPSQAGSQAPLSDHSSQEEDSADEPTGPPQQPESPGHSPPPLSPPPSPQSEDQLREALRATRQRRQEVEEELRRQQSQAGPAAVPLEPPGQELPEPAATAPRRGLRLRRKPAKYFGPEFDNSLISVCYPCAFPIRTF